MKELTSYENYDERVESDSFLTEFSDYSKAFFPKDGSIYLYQYKEANCFTLDSILRKVIHLSLNTEFNDAFEGVPFSFYKDERINHNELQLAKIACLSENSNDQLMWGHYSDGAKGVVLRYDLRRIVDDDTVWKYLFPVIYQEYRCTEIGLSPEELIEMIKNKEKIENIRQLFLYKDTSWSYEKEWRLILTNTDKEFENNNEIAFDCLDAVCFGVKTDISVKNLYYYLIKQTLPGVNIYEAFLDEQRFKFNAFQKRYEP